MDALSRFSTLVWLGLGAAVAMVIGSLGPWAKAVGLVNASISGTEGSNDGALIIMMAIGGAAALLGWSAGPRWLALGTLLAGGAAAATTYYSDRGNVTEISGEKCMLVAPRASREEY